MSLTAMTEYGVWDSEAGGFLSAQAYSPEEAEADRQRLAGEVTPDYRADFLATTSVKAVCPDHEEQPAGECEECTADEAED